MTNDAQSQTDGEFAQILRRLSDQDRQQMVAACWYVALADGRLTREAKLINAIANRLGVSIKQTMRIKKSVASREYNLNSPKDPNASKLLLTMLLQVATNDGRLPGVEQSAVRKIGKLLEWDDSHVEDSIRQLKGTSDRVEPLVTKADSRASEMDINSPEVPASRQEIAHCLYRSIPETAVMRIQLSWVFHGGIGKFMTYAWGIMLILFGAIMLIPSSGDELTGSELFSIPGGILVVGCLLILACLYLSIRDACRVMDILHHGRVEFQKLANQEELVVREVGDSRICVWPKSIGLRLSSSGDWEVIPEARLLPVVIRSALIIVASYGLTAVGLAWKNSQFLIAKGLDDILIGYMLIIIFGSLFSSSLIAAASLWRIKPAKKKSNKTEFPKAEVESSKRKKKRRKRSASPHKTASLQNIQPEQSTVELYAGMPYLHLYGWLGFIAFPFYPLGIIGFFFIGGWLAQIWALVHILFSRREMRFFRLLEYSIVSLNLILFIFFFSGENFVPWGIPPMLLQIALFTVAESIMQRRLAELETSKISSNDPRIKTD